MCPGDEGPNTVDGFAPDARTPAGPRSALRVASVGDVVTGRRAPRATPLADARPQRTRHHGGLLVPSVCAVLTLALCLWRLDGPVLWRDELATWTASRRSLPELFAMLGNIDATAGAYYTFMHGWTAVFGDSAVSLRLPAALAMAGTAACVAALARREFGAHAGLAAGLVFALVPSVSRYGQEARAYGFTCLTVAVSTLLLARALDRPERRRRWAAYAATVPLIGLWHLVASAALAGHAAWVIVEHRRARGPFALSVVAGLAPLAPVFAVAAGQRERQIEWIPRPELDAVQTLLPRMAASGPVAAALIVLAVGAWTGQRVRRGALMAYTWMALLPVAVVWIVSRAGEMSYFLPRYLLFTLPAWAVLAGAGLAVLAERWTPPGRRVPAGLLAVAVLAVLGCADQRALRSAGAHEERDYPRRATLSWVDYAGIARVVRADLRPGDGIVYSSIDQRLWHVDAGVEYYLRGEPRPADVLLGVSAEAMNGLWTYDCLVAASCLDCRGVGAVDAHQRGGGRPQRIVDGVQERGDGASLDQEPRVEEREQDGV
jgi:mannosyltransferase